MKRESELAVRTRCIEKDEEGSEYFLFRGDKHRIYVQTCDDNWLVIDDSDVLQRTCSHSRHECWSRLAELHLDLQRAPLVAGDEQITAKHLARLPQVSSVRAVAIPTLYAKQLIRELYPQYFENDRLSQCSVCGSVFLPSRHCPRQHGESVSEAISLSRCLLIQLELGLAPMAMKQAMQEQWTPSRRLIWQEQGERAMYV